MFTRDDLLMKHPELAQREFESRLRQAEHERLVQHVLAQQAEGQTNLLERVGDLLIAFGKRLKAEMPQNDTQFYSQLLFVEKQ